MSSCKFKSDERIDDYETLKVDRTPSLLEVFNLSESRRLVNYCTQLLYGLKSTSVYYVDTDSAYTNYKIMAWANQSSSWEGTVKRRKTIIVIVVYIPFWPWRLICFLSIILAIWINRWKEDFKRFGDATKLFDKSILLRRQGKIGTIDEVAYELSNWRSDFER